MYSRSFLLRLKIFLELLSAQSSNWEKVKPNTSLSIDFFISSAPELNSKTTFVGFIGEGDAQLHGLRKPQIASAAHLPQEMPSARGKHEKANLGWKFPVFPQLDLYGNPQYPPDPRNMRTGY
jgi:hypothetical protein